MEKGVAQWQVVLGTGSLTMEENWFYIPGYGKVYSLSNFGRIRRNTPAIYVSCSTVYLILKYRIWKIDT